MRVYVATAFHNREERTKAIQALAELGIGITYDWAVEKEVDLASAGQADLDGVAKADAVVVLLPGGKGTHVEIGYALALEVPVILCGAQPRPEGWEPSNADGHVCPFYLVEGVTRLESFSAEAVASAIAATVATL